MLTVAVVAIGLAFNGAGAWSLDAAIGWDADGLAFGLGAAVAALVGASRRAGGVPPARSHRGSPLGAAR